MNSHFQLPFSIEDAHKQQHGRGSLHLTGKMHLCVNINRCFILDTGMPQHLVDAINSLPASEGEVDHHRPSAKQEMNGLWVSCRSLTRKMLLVQICGHRTALVGDAAHAVTSVLGQGCNTALSTCSALDRALADCDPSHTQQLNGALEHYNADWLPQAHALQQLEYMSVSKMP